MRLLSCNLIEMASKKHYKINPETLEYEIYKASVAKKFLKFSVYLFFSIVAFLGIFYLYSGVFHFKTPKAMLLERKLQDWHSKIAVLDERLNKDNDILNELQLRDNSLYRPIFGMEEISDDVREAGFGGVDRYDYLEKYDHSGLLTSYAKKIDIVQKKAFVQSRSFDDVSAVSKTTGLMALCIPSICPIAPKVGNKLSSFFGVRLDPVEKKVYRMHEGIDISSSRKGEPVYATGDGVVTKVGFNFFGYGNYIIIDHGFGYQTRYAHLKGSFVFENQKIKRGDHIAEMGSTGRSKGLHLHYEVIYKGNPVNPLNYYNPEITMAEYAPLVRKGV